jgi:phosphoesterase RecJ-like protein
VIDKKIAVSLLTGLITDTDNFSNGATNQNSLKIASELIHYGANFNMIKSWFLKNKSITTLKLWGVALSRLTKHEVHDFVHTHIRRSDLEETQASEEETDGIANFLNNVGEGQAAILLKETADGKIKASLRTTKDNFDVGALAKALGGGGHKKASGFIMEGTVESVLVRIGEEVEKMNEIV